MNIFEMFKTDERRETNGRWVDYGDKSGRFLVAHIKQRDSAYSKLLRAKLKPYRRQIQAETMDESTLRDIMVDVFAEKGLLGWEGVHDAEGQEIPYSADKAKWLLRELPVLYDDLFEVAGDFSNFRLAESEADAKNSGNA
jgi:hypothetical protein